MKEVRISTFISKNNINVAFDHVIDFLIAEGCNDLNRNSKINLDLQQKLLQKFKSETKEQLVIKHKDEITNKSQPIRFRKLLLIIIIYLG